MVSGQEKQFRNPIWDPGRDEALVCIYNKIRQPRCDADHSIVLAGSDIADFAAEA
jgi:hypothetical protein